MIDPELRECILTIKRSASALTDGYRPDDADHYHKLYRTVCQLSLAVSVLLQETTDNNVKLVYGKGGTVVGATLIH